MQAWSNVKVTHKGQISYASLVQCQGHT